MKCEEEKSLHRLKLENVGEAVIWSRKQVLAIALLCRILLIFYGHIHDYFFEVQFTDTDYKVYSDAAEHVFYGRSPYQRATYRYTPLLAWLLIPVVKWPDFGKILFCTVDVLVGYLYFKFSADKITKKWTSHMKSVVVFWLINPLTAIISSRGNADVLVCGPVLWILYLLSRNQWRLAALIHGLLAIHLKLYPVIYLPSIFLSLSDVSFSSGWSYCCNRMLSNMKGFVFVLISCGSFLASVVLCFTIYDKPYLHEALLYHLHRKDTRHNFSPYFYLLYLASEDSQLSRLISFGAFLPQTLLIIWFALRFHDDLPTCWLFTTMTFVSFNKVCTSQYFIWYICLLPVASHNIGMSTKQAMYMIALWFMGQAAWLYPAYLFEFYGYNSFFLIWFSSLLFLVINTSVIVILIHHRIPGQNPTRKNL